MWNRFRLWANKNEIKIITVIVCILGCYILIKGMNVFFRNQQQEKKNNYEVQNKSIFEDITLSEEGLEEIDKSSNEYQVVYTIEDKIINTIYIAKKNNDKDQKQSLIDMCSEQFLDTLGYGKKYITTDNILSYIDDLNNINNYSIIKIYKIGEKNNVVKYAINLKLPDVEGTIVYNYMIINIDENNRTFSYDGNIEVLSEYAFDDQYDTIENKGSNVF